MTAGAIEDALWGGPADGVSWAAFSDELTAQGDIRGELIRLEQELDRTSPTLRPALQAKIDKLTKQHSKEWTAELPTGATVLEYRHGFPDHVSVAWDDEAAALIERVLRCRFVTGLTLGSDGDLYLAEVAEDDDGVFRIHPSEEGFGALALLDLGRLRHLSLANLGIGDLGAEAIAVASQLTLAGRALTTVDLRYCAIGDAGLAALAGAPIAGPVTRLHLQANALTAAGMPALARFGHLEEVDLRYNLIGLEGVRALLDAPFIGSLRRLWLTANDVGEAGVDLLAEAPQLTPSLRSYWRGVRANRAS